MGTFSIQTCRRRGAYLVDRQIEVYEQPSGPNAAPAYAKTTFYHVGDLLPLMLDGVAVATFAVADLLP